MKQLCKDLYIDYSPDYTTTKRKNDLVLYDRGHVIKTLRLTDPAAKNYMRRIYQTMEEKLLADFIESLDGLYPEVIARTATLLACNAHPLKVAEYLNHYASNDEQGDVEIMAFEKHVRELLSATEKFIRS